MWYKLGKIKSGNKPNKIIGKDTNWVFAGIESGDIFLLDNYSPLEIISIEDNTHLTLGAEVGISNWQEYKIIQVHSATMQARVTKNLADLLSLVRRLFDEETNTLRGQSAYEIAQENGFSGTIDEWLESLKGGPKGDPGTNGKSAFELAKDEGFAGNLTAWLESLKGEAGQSSYELACEKGFNGTLAQYLDSLHGKDGKDGNDGENGLSSYEIAVANGFIGSQLAWLESLRADCRYCPHYHHGYFHHLPCPPEPPKEGEEPPTPPTPITNNIYVGDSSQVSSETWDGGDLDNSRNIDGGNLDDAGTEDGPSTVDGGNLDG